MKKTFGRYDEKTGTSMAAPVVSGVSALVLSHYPYLTPQQIKSVITSSDNMNVMANLNGKVSSIGMVNAFKTLSGNEADINARSVDMIKESRNPFAERDVKSVIYEIMSNTSDHEKTGNLFVKLNENIELNAVLATVSENTNISFKLIGSVGIENAYELSTDSVKSADQLVNIFNSMNDVAYAEPNYIRSA